MADRWIVSAWKFKEHSTLEAAEKEVERLRTLAPKKTFVVHRKKTTLQASNAGAMIAGLRQSLRFFAERLDVFDLQPLPDEIAAISKEMRERAETFDSTPAE